VSFRETSEEKRLTHTLLLALHGVIAAICIAAIVAGCGEHSSPARSRSVATASAPAQNSRLEPTATIRELMDDLVDPSADGLWGSVGIVRTKSTTIRRQPRTGDQWVAVRAQAMTLVESANLLIIGPRHAAPEGTTAGEDELSPPEIDERIAANRAAFEELAADLRNVARKGLSAIDRRDSQELFAVGGEIDDACEACHATFWYPGQFAPKTSK
jgi:hypothetical protein